MSNLKALISNGRGFKSINPWDPDDTPQAWTGGQPTVPSGRLVPVVYAAWQLRCKALADLPFCIYGKGDAEIDNSDDYQGVVTCLPDPYQTFWKMEGSLCGSGSYYFFREQNSAIVKALRYWTAESVTEIKYDLKKYLPEVFMRKTDKTSPTPYPVRDVHYCWLPDPAVEVGPPTVWPLLSALLVANSLDSVNRFINDYASRGFAKMFLLAISGAPPQQEKERIENWWNSFWNKANTVRWRIFNADKIEPTVIGEGLEALNGQEITTALQEQVLAAMGVPASLIMANAANYATAEQDVRTFYQNTIMPDARIIQSALNVQVLEPMGYHLEFEPERLETFQTDEAERATALSTLAGVLTDSSPEAVTLSMSILGYDLTPEQEAMLDEMIAQKQKDREAMAEQVKPNPEDETSEEEPEESEYAGEMNKWMRKALKHIGKDVNFVSDKIPASVQARVHKSLPACASEADVMKVFSAPEPERGDPAILALAEALREAAKAVSVTPIPQASPNVSIVLPETIRMDQLPTVVNVPAPVVNVSVEPTPVTVTNDVKVEPTPVKVENKVDVQPATVKATEVKQTKQPKSRKEKQKILRDKGGQIEGSETTVTYEY